MMQQILLMLQANDADLPGEECIDYHCEILATAMTSGDLYSAIGDNNCTNERGTKLRADATVCPCNDLSEGNAELIQLWETAGLVWPCGGATDSAVSTSTAPGSMNASIGRLL